MNAEYVRINLRYDRADLKSLLVHVQSHDVEHGGRYDMRNATTSQHLDAQLDFTQVVGRNRH